MATLNPEQIIAPQDLTASNASYYTVPALTVTSVRRITFTNTSTATVAFSVNYAPGGAAATTNLVIFEEPLGPKKSVSPPELEGIVLEAGDEIWIKATTAVNVVGSGTEIS
jgi:hypothetical protein